MNAFYFQTASFMLLIKKMKLKGLRNLFLTAALVLFISPALFAQKGSLELLGNVKQNGKGLEGAEIKIMKGNEQVDNILSGNNGKFIINLDLDAVYTLLFTKSGCVTKSIIFDTRVPEPIKNQLLSNRKFGIELFKIPEGVEQPKELDKPVAKWSWNDSYDDFDYDLEYSNARKQENEQIKKVLEEQAVAQEKQRNDSLAHARLDSINKAKAAEQVRLAELAQKKKEEEQQKKLEAERQAAFAAAKKREEDSLRAEQLKADALERARLAALEKARKDSIEKAKALAEQLAKEKAAEEKRLAALEKARLDSIAKADAAEKARLAALEKERQDSLARVKAEEDRLAREAAKEQARLAALEKARQDSIAKAKAAEERPCCIGKSPSGQFSAG